MESILILQSCFNNLSAVPNLPLAFKCSLKNYILLSSFAKISINPHECDVESLLTSIIPWEAFPHDDSVGLRDFRLRIHGRDEFLRPGVKLSRQLHFQESFRQNTMPVKVILEHVIDLDLHRLRRSASDFDRPFVLPQRNRVKELAKWVSLLFFCLFCQRISTEFQIVVECEPATGVESLKESFWSSVRANLFLIKCEIV